MTGIIVNNEIQNTIFLSVNLLSPTVVVSLLVSVTSRWHCSQVVIVYSHHFHLPAPAAKEKKASMCLYHPGSEGFFQLVCSEARCSVYDTQRISVTDKLTGKCTAVPALIRCNARFKGSVQIALKTNDHSFGDRQPKTVQFFSCTPVARVTGHEKQCKYALLIRLPASDLSKGK